jgi:hypothetical protein
MVYGHPTFDAGFGHLMTDAFAEDHRDNLPILGYPTHWRGDIEVKRWRRSLHCGAYISVSDIGYQ